MKSTKENKGITIIALIITIVVLLILAGVTIDLVVGNDNLFDKARSTQKIQTVAWIYKLRVRQLIWIIIWSR